MIGKVELGKVVHICPRCKNKRSLDIEKLSIFYLGDNPSIGLPTCLECKTIETLTLTLNTSCVRLVSLFAQVLRGGKK